MTEPPGPLLEIAIEPKAAAKLDLLLASLEREVAADPSLEVRYDPQTRQTIVGGRDEPHLEAAIGRVRAKLDVVLGALQVAYRETVTRRVEADHTHKRQLGGMGAFARVKLVVAPGRPLTPATFANEVGGAIPDEFVEGAEAGIATVMRAGILAGCPLMAVDVRLIDGAYHDTDSSPLAFEVAARGAMVDALRGGRSVLLEPVMAVAITTPSLYAAAIRDDLRRRRAAQETREPGDLATAIGALVPLANLFGYAAQLRMLARGEATATVRYATYWPLPTVGDDDFPMAAAMRA